LDFLKGFYGPYSGKVRHILYEVDGYYLKGYEEKDGRPFEPLELTVDKAPAVRQYILNELSQEERNRLNKVAELITGFESPYGLELLATIDYLIQENNTFDATIIAEKLWSERKRKMFSNEHIDTAISHLLAYRKDLYYMTAE
jgi:hypothetical protein